MKIHRFDTEDSKFYTNNPEHRGHCAHCNWETTMLHVLATTMEEAEELLHDGLCSECLCDMMVEGHYTITKENDHEDPNQTGK